MCLSFGVDFLANVVKNQNTKANREYDLRKVPPYDYFSVFISLVQKLCFADFFSLFQIRQKQES